jgi:predicted nucleotidyltransferase
MMEIPRTFLEFIKSLNSRDVRFLLLGGYAVSYCGSSRTTTDIDFWLEISPANAKAALAAIHDFGFTDSPVTFKDLQKPGKIFQMGKESMRIDLFTAPSGVEFAECYQRAIAATFDGVPVRIISREDLLKNKIASARLKDLRNYLAS